MSYIVTRGYGGILVVTRGYGREVALAEIIRLTSYIGQLMQLNTPVPHE